MSRLEATFATLRGRGEKGLVTYVTGGDPDLPRSAEVVRALARGGADVIEIGVAFSDPIADGPAIQRASERALAAGAQLSTTFDLIEAVRRDITPPVVLFTYVNPVFRFGLERFAARASQAGVDAVLLLDLPIEEAAQTKATLESHGLDQIFLISPTTSDARLRQAAEFGRGFLYAISRLGVTGSRDRVADTAAPLVTRIRAITSMPVALGFGISRPEHVREVGAFADAAVVGSAIVDRIAEATARGSNPAVEVETFVRWLKGA
jgi:tryptophan synthase alpha chain